MILVGEMREARRGLGIAAFETRFFAVSHCRSLRGHTFCVNRKYAKSHKRGGDCVFPAPFEGSVSIVGVELSKK